MSSSEVAATTDECRQYARRFASPVVEMTMIELAALQKCVSDALRSVTGSLLGNGGNLNRVPSGGGEIPQPEIHRVDPADLFDLMYIPETRPYIGEGFDGDGFEGTPSIPGTHELQGGPSMQGMQ